MARRHFSRAEWRGRMAVGARKIDRRASRGSGQWPVGSGQWAGVLAQGAEKLAQGALFHVKQISQSLAPFHVKRSAGESVHQGRSQGERLDTQAATRWATLRFAPGTRLLLGV